MEWKWETTEEGKDGCDYRKNEKQLESRTKKKKEPQRSMEDELEKIKHGETGGWEREWERVVVVVVVGGEQRSLNLVRRGVCL